MDLQRTVNLKHRAKGTYIPQLLGLAGVERAYVLKLCAVPSCTKKKRMGALGPTRWLLYFRGDCCSDRLDLA